MQFVQINDKNQKIYKKENNIQYNCIQILYALVTAVEISFLCKYVTLLNADFSTLIDNKHPSKRQKKVKINSLLHNVFENVNILMHNFKYFCQ